MCYYELSYVKFNICMRAAISRWRWPLSVVSLLSPSEYILCQSEAVLCSPNTSHTAPVDTSVTSRDRPYSYAFLMYTVTSSDRPYDCAFFMCTICVECNPSIDKNWTLKLILLLDAWLWESQNDRLKCSLIAAKSPYPSSFDSFQKTSIHC